MRYLTVLAATAALNQCVSGYYITKTVDSYDLRRRADPTPAPTAAAGGPPPPPADANGGGPPPPDGNGSGPSPPDANSGGPPPPDANGGGPPPPDANGGGPPPDGPPPGNSNNYGPSGGPSGGPESSCKPFEKYKYGDIEITDINQVITAVETKTKTMTKSYEQPGAYKRPYGMEGEGKVFRFKAGEAHYNIPQVRSWAQREEDYRCSATCKEVIVMVKDGDMPDIHVMTEGWYIQGDATKVYAYGRSWVTNDWPKVTPAPKKDCTPPPDHNGGGEWQGGSDKWEGSGDHQWKGSPAQDKGYEGNWQGGSPTQDKGNGGDLKEYDGYKGVKYPKVDKSYKFPEGVQVPIDQKSGTYKPSNTKGYNPEDWNKPYSGGGGDYKKEGGGGYPSMEKGQKGFEDMWNGGWKQGEPPKEQWNGGYQREKPNEQYKPQEPQGWNSGPPPKKDDYPPSGGYQPPSGGYQPPSGGYKPPSGGYQPPSGGYQPPSGGYKPPSGGYQPPSGGYQPPSGGYQPPSGGYKPPSGGYQPPSGGYKPPSGGYQPPSGGYQPPSGGYQPPSGGYQPPPNGPPTPKDGGGRPIPANYPLDFKFEPAQGNIKPPS